MTAGELLRLVREEAGMSQKELAELARTRQSAVSRVECDVVSPSVVTLARLVEATGVGTLEIGVRRHE
jgi:transcriptional regulator with XRE-family HTH domain